MCVTEDKAAEENIRALTQDGNLAFRTPCESLDSGLLTNMSGKLVERKVPQHCGYSSSLGP